MARSVTVTKWPGLDRPLVRLQLAVAGRAAAAAARRPPRRSIRASGRSSFSPFHCGRSNSGRTSMSNSKTIGPSSGSWIESMSKSGSLIAVN